MIQLLKDADSGIVLTYKNITFDDYVDGEKNVWTQICQPCTEKHGFNQDMLDKHVGSGICGIKGCEDEADHYLDFK